MKHVSVEVFSETVNCPVVRMPERRFPGVVIQGDSLRLLADLGEDIFGLARKGDDGELAAAAAMLRERLAQYIAAYEEALAAHGLELPYNRGMAR